MSLLRQRSWLIDGEILSADASRQVVEVRTSRGETFTNVAVGSPGISNKDKTGWHSFPRKGDKCWLTRDVDRWYVSQFGAAFDPAGRFAAKRPALFRSGYQGVHADLSGIDVLPSVRNERGLSLYATEKLGVTVEVPPESQVSPSPTTAQTQAVFDGSAMVRTLFPCGCCREALAPLDTPGTGPILDWVNVGAILLDRSPPVPATLPEVLVTIHGRNFAKIVDMTKTPVRDRVTLEIPGFPTLRAYISAADATAGTITITVQRKMSGTNATPDGVYDIVLSHPTTGDCLVIIAGLSINSFTPGTVRRTIFNIPQGFYLSFSIAPAIPSQFPKFGLLFGTRQDVAGTVLQEADNSNVTYDNSKYIAHIGKIGNVTIGFLNDLMAIQDIAQQVQDNLLIDTFQLSPLTIDEINLAPTLQCEIQGVANTQTEQDAIATRLTASAVSRLVYETDGARKNLGIELSNFLATDKFRIEVYVDRSLTAPDYSQPPRIDGFDPDRVLAPRSGYLQIEGENFRIGTSFVLLQKKRLTDRGTLTERLVELTPPYPSIMLGSDTTERPHALLVLDGGGETITGEASLYRVSDKVVGLKLNITQISDGLYGLYDLAVTYEPTGFAAKEQCLTIYPAPSAAGAPTVESASSTNVLLQTVKARDTTGEEEELYRYGVDENGRLDFTAKGGVYVNGLSLQASSALAGIVGPLVTAATFVTETGDGGLVTMDGNIRIAAFRASQTDSSKGIVRVMADNCVAIGQDTPKVFVGRRAGVAQFGTGSSFVQVAGDAMTIASRFPSTYAFLTSPGGFPLKALASLGPMLLLDSHQQYTGQSNVIAGATPTGLGSTFFTLISYAHAQGKLLEGRINLIFVPDGLGTGTDTDPFTGTWHLPLA